MAGTLIINANSDWLPAGWLFDSVLDAIAADVESARSDLARILRNARTEGGSGYLDMTGWDAAQIDAVFQAAAGHRTRTESAGAQAFQQPSFFLGYLAQLNDLIEKLRRDPRAASGGSRGSVAPPQQ